VIEPREGAPEVLGEDAFRHILSRETQRATRYQDFFSVCLVKPDTASALPIEIHHAVARKIAECLRATDVVGRLRDGAAFLLLNTASTDAVGVAERVRKKIENVSFPSPAGGPPQRITLSMGKVSFPRDGSSDRLLFSKAEAHLQEAVRRGGNRVVHGDEGPSS
jgi:GGDEF domain-containing protein